MRALAHEWGVEPTDGGKVAWAEPAPGTSAEPAVSAPPVELDDLLAAFPDHDVEPLHTVELGSVARPSAAVPRREDAVRGGPVSADPDAPLPPSEVASRRDSAAPRGRAYPVVGAGDDDVEALEVRLAATCALLMAATPDDVVDVVATFVRDLGGELVPARLAEDEAVRVDVVAPGDAVALLDLDRYKQVNDTGGHAAGDSVLRAVGTVLRLTCATSTPAADTAAPSSPCSPARCPPPRSPPASRRSGRLGGTPGRRPPPTSAPRRGWRPSGPTAVPPRCRPPTGRSTAPGRRARPDGARRGQSRVTAVLDEFSAALAAVDLYRATACVLDLLDDGTPVQRIGRSSWPTRRCWLRTAG